MRREEVEQPQGRSATAAVLVQCAKWASRSIDSSRSYTANRREPVTAGPVDWQQLITAAHRHSMFFHLSRFLSLGCSPTVPEALWKQYRAYFERQARFQILLTTELLVLRQRLLKADIPFMPFKGPALAAYLYGNPLQRQYDDLDILVPKEAALPAREVLCNSGYRLRTEIPAPEEDPYLKYQYEYRLVRENGVVQVGLHWRIADSLYFPMESLPVWGRTESMTLVGNQIPVPSPEDLLLFLSVHGAKDQWARLAWICDVGRLLVVRPRMRWSRLLEEAERVGARRKLLLAINLSSRLLGIKSPDVIEGKIHDDASVESITAAVGGNLFAACAPLSEEQQYQRRVIFYMRVTERLRHRLKSYPRVIHRYNWMTPREIDQAVFQLPRALAFCLILAWPLRILGRFLLSPLRREIRRLRNH